MKKTWVRPGLEASSSAVAALAGGAEAETTVAEAARGGATVAKTPDEIRAEIEAKVRGGDRIGDSLGGSDVEGCDIKVVKVWMWRRKFSGRGVCGSGGNGPCTHRLMFTQLPTPCSYFLFFPFPQAAQDLQERLRVIEKRKAEQVR